MGFASRAEHTGPEFDLAMRTVEAVRAAGGRTLFVGGWVRDHLSDRASKDIDLEVYGLQAETLQPLLEQIDRVNTVGESFTVYKVGPLDVSLPRRESKTGRGHRGFTVTGDPYLSINEAARRRDFTINAIAWDPLTNEFLDPYLGRDDLARGILRMVDSRTFGDDSLRVLRAIQFAARFNLVIDDATKATCRTIPLHDLPPERIWGEVEKFLLRSSRPSVGFALALELGVVKQLFPELEALIGCKQEPEWHPEGDVWTHNLLVVDQAATRLDGLPYPQRVALMLGAVSHDFGKPATTAFLDGRIRSHNHEEAGVEPAKTFLDRLNLHSLSGYDVRRQVLGLVAHHLKPGMWHKAPDGVGDGAFRRLARKVDLKLLARLATSDCLGRTGTFDCSAMNWFLNRAQVLGVEHASPPPLLLGRHILQLGLAPGPRVGRILGQVYERQLDGDVHSLDQAIAAARSLIAEATQTESRESPPKSPARPSQKSS
jgi:tRNA nucleotidyltransferase (CCA-adding enzyme)